MKKIKLHISLFLLLTISFFIVPKELIHSFYGHNDTEHEIHEHCNSPSGISIEEEHTHCEILNLNVPLYIFNFDFIDLKSETPIAFYSSSESAVITKTLFNISLLRAPPEVFS